LKHLDRIDAEFTRQAATFAASATLGTADLTERVAAALADATDGRVLDVACGPGILTAALAERFAAPVGLDFTAETLRLARTRIPAGRSAAFVRGLAEALPFPDGAFDGAAVRLALHHFEDPASVLREVRRTLAPGARLAVLDILTSADPAEAHLHDAIERLRDPSHAAFTTEAGLRDQVEAAGFAIQSAESWDRDRPFDEWAAIVNAPQRMAALEVLLRRLARAGETAGIALREADGGVWFTYRFAFVVARAV